MYLYYYRAISGKHIPHTTTKDLIQLQNELKDSVTPLVRVLEITTRNEAKNAVMMLEAQLTHTSRKQTGMIHSIEWCIRDLQKFILDNIDAAISSK